MIDVRAILLPSLLKPEDIAGRAVVVFDVLRATTTIAAAMHNHVKLIRVFDSIDSVRHAMSESAEPAVCAGEVKCLKPPGFDFGNSPGEFTRPAIEGKTLFMSTTNGTRALHAAKSAQVLLAGALVNAWRTAEELHNLRLPVTLLCAGTDGNIAMEDLLGAGAVLEGLYGLEHDRIQPGNDEALLCRRLFQEARSDLRAALESTQGGINVIRANLGADIHFASQLGSLNILCLCDPQTMSFRQADGL